MTHHYSTWKYHELTGCTGHGADELDGINQAVFVGVEEAEKIC